MSHLDPNSVRLGLVVEHKHQPEKGLGMLSGKTMDSMVLMVEVAWAGGKIDFEPILSLKEFEIAQDDSFESIVSRGRYGQIDEFRSLMTFEKLQGDLSNVMYSMRTAEIDFFAHQFVTVLKFVNSPLSRLLIADEVGLGKTIEAGLIWTECRARFKSRRLLIICPPAFGALWSEPPAPKRHEPPPDRSVRVKLWRERITTGQEAEWPSCRDGRAGRGCIRF
jgi:SNF2 family DNA or RNA helicase